MAIIIGSATQVSFGGECVISASWSSNANTERLYCIGSWDPFLTSSKPTQSLNLTLYAPGPSYDVSVTRSCANANTINASIDPAGCGGSVTGVNGSWFVTQYSYTKEDPVLPGQESWSLTQWIGGANMDPPTYVLRGFAEGEGTDDSGITFTGSSIIIAHSGSISANSIGRANTVTQGQVSRVGGGVGVGNSVGNGSVSIPYTPLYL